MIGARIRRLEDPRFLRGDGRYVDDLPAHGAVHVGFVRSVYAHARIGTIDTVAARRTPGVVAVATATTMGARNGPFPHPTWMPPSPTLVESADARAHPELLHAFAQDRVRYVGEVIAAVVAVDRATAADAVDAVRVTYDPLPVVADPDRALAPNAPLIHPEWGSNLAASFRVVAGDPAAAFAAADVVVRGSFRVPRCAGVPIEPRGALAIPDMPAGGLTVWSATQTPHWLRNTLASILGLSHELVRVVAPDVGGGFGVKSMVYPEELAVALLALDLGRPVKWIDTRREHFLTTIQARDQRHDIELAVAADGAILGVRDRFIVDAGASNVEAFVVPYNTAAHLRGPYRIPSADIGCRVALTNKAPLSAYRGAGRPEAVFALERIIDQAARRLGLDRVLFRRLNTLRPDELPFDAGMPYRDGGPMVVDGGDYGRCLDIAADAIGDVAPRTDKAGRTVRGTGYAAYIEGTGIGPYEVADVSVEPSGTVVVAVGLPSQGQGHATTLAQICADRLGVPVDRIRVVQGDTSRIADAGGTLASRTAVVVGNAVADAAARLRELAIAAAADLLEAAPTDLDVADGTVCVEGSPDRAIALGELAGRMAPGSGRSLGGRIGPLRAIGSFEPPSVTFANGVHAAEVEVDLGTGQVRIVRYVVVHDCGTVINPAIVEGQIAGGVAQGIGAALLEELVYDETGQLLTSTLADYLIPTASDIPELEIHHLETPSRRNPLGIRGAGEAGTIAVQATIAGAVEDALGGANAVVATCPLTPDRVLALARAAAIHRSAPDPDRHAAAAS